MKIEYLKNEIIAALEDTKGRNIEILDIKDITDIADYMVIASGTSSRHVTSLADNVITRLREQGLRPFGTEGLDSGEWALIDYGDIIVHVMQPQAREFYALEKLWRSTESARLSRENTPT